MKKQDNTIILVVGGLVCLYFINSIKDGFSSLFNNPTVANNNSRISQYLAQKAIDNPFDPQYIIAIQNANPGVTITYKTEAFIAKLAKDIYESVGFWTGILPGSKDSTHEIQAAFSQLSNKAQVAQLARKFYGDYGRDLLTFLQYDVDKYGMFQGDKHARIVDTILNRVKNLKPY